MWSRHWECCCRRRSKPTWYRMTPALFLYLVRASKISTVSAQCRVIPSFFTICYKTTDANFVDITQPWFQMTTLAKKPAAIETGKVRRIVRIEVQTLLTCKPRHTYPNLVAPPPPGVDEGGFRHPSMIRLRLKPTDAFIT